MSETDKSGVADALIRAAFGAQREQVNLSSLARTLGISVPRLHGYWNGRTPWPADVAVAVLAASGRLRTDGEAFRFEGDVPPRVVGLFSRMARGGYELRRPSGEASKQRSTKN